MFTKIANSVKSNVASLKAAVADDKWSKKEIAITAALTVAAVAVVGAIGLRSEGYTETEN